MKSFLFLLLFISSINFADAQMFNQMTGLLTQTKKTRCGSFSSNWTPGMNSNIVGYWKMDGALGAAADLSSVPATTGSNGTIHGTTGSYVAGAISQALNTTGASTYVEVPAYAGINDLATMTLMTWIKVSANTAGGLFYKSDNNTSQGWYFFINSGDYRLFFNAVAGTNLKYKTHNDTSLIAGTWAQIVLTWDGVVTSFSGVHIYVNGVEWGTAGSGFTQNGAGAHNSDAAQKLFLGYGGSGVPAHFTGAMDETAIWNRVLNAAEVAHLYKNQKCN
ncbi:LamG domain-containing protein [Bacteriovorax sp. PP10]|uniref:LamG domain-containing protein n=1 Tax=Bacteriovorax antarcticus TaxID=3088717 RepID=A0ABU5VXT6_9BACT|nr:LamG domain-containing protein [Bacteriovorax sp. PP10]MEA9357879.1 LamG domain-containing protein [Bacteriovorax sp. PP10]